MPAETTFFLFVLVIALVIGNVFLSLISGRKNPVMLMHAGQTTQMQVSRSSTAAVAASVTESQSANLPDAFNNKIFLLARQMAAMDAKVSKFDAFRQNTKVELKGIMEILQELQNKHLTVKGKKLEKAKKQKEQEEDLSTEQMHKIIYRSRGKSS